MACTLAENGQFALAYDPSKAVNGARRVPLATLVTDEFNALLLEKILPLI
jgi:hypothetical protein